MEKRVLIAFVLSAVIFAVWSVLFPPPKREMKPMPTPTVVADTEGTSQSGEDLEGAETSEDTDAELTEPVEQIEGEVEELATLENDVMSLRLTSRGAALQSVVLIGHTGDDGSALDLVQHFDHPQRALPGQLMEGKEPDTRIYAVESIENGVVYRWADGRGASVEKTISIPDQGYGIDIDVRTTGKMEKSQLVIGTGMRDTGIVERKNRFSTWGDVIVVTGENIDEYKREKLDETKIIDDQRFDFIGFSDTYFISLFESGNTDDIARAMIEPLTFEEVNDDEEIEVLPILQVRLDSVDGVWDGRLFAAPKQYDLLLKEDGGLENILDFGFFHPISVFFLRALQWIHGKIGNWGWSIVILTLGLRILLFPLMHTSTVSMRRMQKMQPKVKAIQEKYKKNKSDPQIRAKMNQETMALYKAEGVNPMGGCLPMLVQLPILWALYTLFAHAIELRHAPFIWWIVDLSAKDPLLITPVLMTGTMWLQQRLAPQAGDPQQQKIFRLMPLIFGIMFLGFPAGLVLYWLTNNVITIFQQELTLRIIGERGGKGKQRSKKKDGKK